MVGHRLRGVHRVLPVGGGCQEHRQPTGELRSWPLGLHGGSAVDLAMEGGLGGLGAWGHGDGEHHKGKEDLQKLEELRTPAEARGEVDEYLHRLHGLFLSILGVMFLYPCHTGAIVGIELLNIFELSEWASHSG